MENYEHIYYLNCPHFTVGRVDQWGEQGFLFHEGHVYEYTEDRKDQWGRTFNQMSIAEETLVWRVRIAPADGVGKVQARRPAHCFEIVDVVMLFV